MIERELTWKRRKLDSTSRVRIRRTRKIKKLLKKLLKLNRQLLFTKRDSLKKRKKNMRLTNRNNPRTKWRKLLWHHLLTLRRYLLQKQAQKAQRRRSFLKSKRQNLQQLRKTELRQRRFQSLSLLQSFRKRKSKHHLQLKSQSKDKEFSTLASTTSILTWRPQSQPLRSLKKVMKEPGVPQLLLLKLQMTASMILPKKQNSRPNSETRRATWLLTQLHQLPLPRHLSLNLLFRSQSLLQ